MPVVFPFKSAVFALHKHLVEVVARLVVVPPRPIFFSVMRGLPCPCLDNRKLPMPASNITVNATVRGNISRALQYLLCAAHVALPPALCATQFIVCNHLAAAFALPYRALPAPFDNLVTINVAHEFKRVLAKQSFQKSHSSVPKFAFNPSFEMTSSHPINSVVMRQTTDAK